MSAMPGIQTPLFSLCGFKTKGRLVDIVDGDTVYLVLPLFNSFYKFNCRIAGIDTCEKNGKNKQLGIDATRFSYQFFLGQHNLDRKQLKLELDKNPVIVDVECFTFDKYGRLLIAVYFNGQSLAVELVNHKLAYEYKGGHKLSIEEQQYVLT